METSGGSQNPSCDNEDFSPLNYSHTTFGPGLVSQNPALVQLFALLRMPAKRTFHRESSTGSESSCSSSRHRLQVSSRSVGTFSSQSTPRSQSLWSNILALMVVGVNHPRMSNVLATSETNNRFVGDWSLGKSDTVRRKTSFLEFHSIPSVLTYSGGSGMV